MRALLVVLVIAGCASQGAMQLSTGQAEVRAMPGGELPQPVMAFRREVRQMAENQDPRHEQTVDAMKAMSEAVQTLPPGQERDEASRRINEQASKLEHSPKNAVHSDAALRALGAATVALDVAAVQRPVAGWPARIAAARSAVAKIDPTTPYLQQRDVIDRAFIEVAEAFAMGTAASPTATVQTLVHRQTTVKLDRWAGDMRGPSPDIQALCGGPAKTLRIQHTPADVTAAIFTFGWYTPVHVQVTCVGPLKTVMR